eukprot:scaffold73121_cov30-Tisochrysis_lutea.AAC.3
MCRVLLDSIAALLALGLSAPGRHLPPPHVRHLRVHARLGHPRPHLHCVGAVCARASKPRFALSTGIRCQCLCGRTTALWRPTLRRRCVQH